MKLYDYEQAPNPRRVRMFMAEKGIDIPVEQVDLGTRAQLNDDFVAINPFAAVPALETDDGEILTESTAICHYLEGLQPEPNLLGATPLEKAQIMMWDRRIELEFMAGIAEAFRNSNPNFVSRSVVGTQNFEQIPELVERGTARTHAGFEMLNNRLGETEFIAGDRFTIADITAFIACGFARWIRLSPADNHANTQRWLDSISARPSASA
jgi:glutathione S-transferase